MPPIIFQIMFISRDQSVVCSTPFQLSCTSNCLPPLATKNIQLYCVNLVIACTKKCTGEHLIFVFRRLQLLIVGIVQWSRTHIVEFFSQLHRQILNRLIIVQLNWALLTMNVHNSCCRGRTIPRSNQTLHFGQRLWLGLLLRVSLMSLRDQTQFIFSESSNNSLKYENYSRNKVIKTYQKCLHVELFSNHRWRKESRLKMNKWTKRKNERKQ